MIRPDKRLALLLLALISASCYGTPTTATYAGGDFTGSIAMGNFTRTYRVHVPRRDDPGPIAPLIIAFHGVAQNGEELETLSRLDTLANSIGAIVVYPDAALGAWDVTGDFVAILGIDDLAFTQQLIDRVTQDFVVDERRILVTGMSNGGVFVQRLACELSDQIIGFVSVSATLPRSMMQNCAAGRPISATYVVGSADFLFPVAGNEVLLSVDSTMAFWAERNRCTGRRTSTAVPGQGGTVTWISRYAYCASADVELDSVAVAGHVWHASANAVIARMVGPGYRGE